MSTAKAAMRVFSAALFGPFCAQQKGQTGSLDQVETVITPSSIPGRKPRFDQSASGGFFLVTRKKEAKKRVGLSIIQPHCRLTGLQAWAAYESGALIFGTSQIIRTFVPMPGIRRSSSPSAMRQ